MLNWWQVIATSFFSKELTLLSQTLTCVFKAVSFATCPSSAQVSPALKLGCCIRHVPQAHWLTLAHYATFTPKTAIITICSNKYLLHTYVWLQFLGEPKMFSN